MLNYSVYILSVYGPFSDRVFGYTFQIDHLSTSGAEGLKGG